MSFEKKILRLEELVAKMERGDTTLEDSLKFFEEGVQLSRECHQQLTQAESSVKKLIGFDKAGTPITEPFEPEDN